MTVFDFDAGNPKVQARAAALGDLIFRCTLDGASLSIALCRDPIATGRFNSAVSVLMARPSSSSL